MAYEVTPEDMGSIQDVEMAFSTDRLLPAWEDIPQEFRDGNQYTRMAEALMYGWPLPDGTIEMQEGFTPEMLNRAVRSHLQSYGPKHEHKVAGVGYMMSRACTLTLTGAAQETSDE